ncbi:hypothetical protein AaE_013739 [Aphanomyces astaci]|nr:hypothetical protein AaE_013739 [Aphanomyces astaci]
MFSMWDDCMCFPDLLVRVSRHASISLGYLNHHGQIVHEDALPQAESELFQHELDHLDGILAVNLVSKDLLSADELLERFPSHVIQRRAFDMNPTKFQKLVDYVI